VSPIQEGFCSSLSDVPNHQASQLSPPFRNTRFQTHTAIEEQKNKFPQNVASLIPPIRVSPRLSSNVKYVSARKAQIQSKIKAPKWFDAPKSILDQGNHDDYALRKAEQTFSLTKFRVSSNFVH